MCFIFSLIFTDPPAWNVKMLKMVAIVTYILKTIKTSRIAFCALQIYVGHVHRRCSVAS